MLRLLLAVFLSGAASLIYQVSWTRRLADVTSATAQAQAIVLAIFFAGLGLGAVFPGGRATRMRRPLVGYCLVELGALVSALGSMRAFGALDHARALASRAGLSPHAALGVELGLAGVFLLVPAAMMGASMPFVLEHVERSAAGSAPRRFVSVAYAINTLGAAVGCALAGFVLVERIGLIRATAVGATLSLAAALLAASTLTRTGATAPTTAGPEPQASDASMSIPLALAAAGAGLVGVGAEVVWTRLFSLLVLNTVYAFTQVLVAVLLGIVIGAAIARAIGARAEGLSLLRAGGLMQACAAIAIACVPPTSLLLAGRTTLEASIAKGQSPLGAVALVLVLAVPVALNAATLPLVVQAIRGARLARSFGAVYAANTAGSVLGSLLCGFVFIPFFGTSGASAILEAVSVAVGIALVWLGSTQKRDAFAGLVPGLVVPVVHFLFPHVQRDIYEARLPPRTVILELREGVASDVLVSESDTGQRRLWINSAWVAGTGGGHKVLGHLPALFVDEPRRAIGIALGTGQSFAAVLANGATELHIVEINPDVIRLSRRWFAEANEHLFERPGVTTHAEDGRAFLRAQTDRFELIVLEPLQAWSAGTSSLYSREFYEDARRVLSPSGVLAQWIPFYGQGVEATKAMVRTALEVFPTASLWLDENDGILLLHGGPIVLPPEKMEARIVARGIGAALGTRSIDGAVDVLSLLVLGPDGLARWTRGAEVMTDDRPFLEFTAARSLGQPAFEPIVASIVATRRELPVQSAIVTGGETAMALEANRASSALLALSLLPSTDTEARATLLEAAIATAPSASLLRGRYRGVIEAWGAQLVAAHADDATLEALLRRAVEHDDTYGEAMLNLAVLAVRRNDLGTARAHLERAVRIPRVKDRATKMLADLP